MEQISESYKSISVLFFSVEQLNLLNSQIRHFSKNHEKFSKSGIFRFSFSWVSEDGRKKT